MDNLEGKTGILLDGGCGDGTFSHPLSSQFRIIGLDIDPRELRRSKGMLDGIACDLAHQPIRDGVIANIMTNSVMEHVPHLSEAMREYGRVTISGGTLFMTVPYHSPFRLFRVLASVLFNIAHSLPPYGWKQLMVGSGFTVTKFEEYSNKAFHVVYMIACIFVPLFIVDRVLIQFMKRLKTNGVHVCLVGVKD